MRFYLDLTKSKLEIFQHHPDDPPSESDYDWREFATEEEADAFLDLYLKTLKGLKRLPSPLKTGMLLKRRYMVLAAMGLKMQTYRHYKKKWNVGQEFYFHDQTFHLSARLISLEQVEGRGYCYKYEIL